MMIGAYDRRFKSGEVCVDPGGYEFDGYLDGSSELLPALEEMDVRLLRGQVFPLIRSQWRACFWRSADVSIAAADELDSGDSAVGW